MFWELGAYAFAGLEQHLNRNPGRWEEKGGGCLSLSCPESQGQVTIWEGGLEQSRCCAVQCSAVGCGCGCAQESRLVAARGGDGGGGKSEESRACRDRAQVREEVAASVCHSRKPTELNLPGVNDHKMSQVGGRDGLGARSCEKRYDEASASAFGALEGPLMRPSSLPCRW